LDRADIPLSGFREREHVAERDKVIDGLALPRDNGGLNAVIGLRRDGSG
jgi:hypothetical protein